MRASGGHRFGRVIDMNIGGKKSTEQGSTTSATTISQVLPVDDFAQDFSENLKQAYSEQGAVTVCVFGKSGCGKSTLINTIFGEIVADTGYGRPVIQDCCLYVHESGNLRLIDSRGAEIGRDDQQLQSGLDALVADSKADGGQGRIHVAWYCVAWNHRRFEDSDVRLIERLRGHGIPVIVVMTKVPMIGDRIHKDAQTLAESILSRGVPVHMQRVFPTCALADLSLIHI